MRVHEVINENSASAPIIYHSSNSFVLRLFQTNPIGAEKLFSANRIGGEKLNFADFLKCYKML